MMALKNTAERSISLDANDGKISDAFQCVEVVILCDDRQVPRGSDRRDPQIVDSYSAPGLSEMDAQQRPYLRCLLVDRQCRHVGNSVQRPQATGANLGRAGG